MTNRKWGQLWKLWWWIFLTSLKMNSHILSVMETWLETMLGRTPRLRNIQAEIITIWKSIKTSATSSIAIKWLKKWKWLLMRKQNSRNQRKDRLRLLNIHKSQRMRKCKMKPTQITRMLKLSTKILCLTSTNWWHIKGLKMSKRNQFISLFLSLNTSSALQLSIFLFSSANSIQFMKESLRLSKS